MKKLIPLLIVMVLILTLTVIADTNEDDNILSIVELRLTSGDIEGYQILRSKEVADEKQIEDTLKYLLQREDVIAIITIDGIALEETIYGDYIKDLWEEDSEKKEEDYKSDDGFDVIGKDKEGSVIEKEEKEVLQKVNVLMDNKALKTDVAPFIQDGRVMIPIRFVAEEYDVNMGWKVINKDLKIIWMEKNQFYIYLKIGDIRAFKSNEIVYMDTAPLIFKSRTFVPLSFISDIFNYKVEYNSKTNTATICTNDGVAG